ESLSRSKSRSRPRLSAWVTPWLLPPVTLPATSLTKVNVGLRPRSSALERTPNHSPNRWSRGSASWNGRRLTGVLPLDPSRTLEVFVCGSAALRATGFMFVRTSDAPLSRVLASPRVLLSPKNTPHISSAENPGGQNEFAGFQGIQSLS